LQRKVNTNSWNNKCLQNKW